MRLVRASAAAAAFAGVVATASEPVPPDNPLLLSSTLLGRLGANQVRAARIGPDGALWFCGGSETIEFPGAEHPEGEFSARDAFVIRLDPATRQVLSSVWIGGTGLDTVIALEFDAAGNAFVAGVTESPDFPYTAGLAGAGEYRPAAFVARLAPDAKSFAWVFALGGSGADTARGLCLTDDGDPVVVGHTSSVDFPFTGPLGEARGDRERSDAFVTRVAADGSKIVFSSFIGGSSFDFATAAVRVPGGIVIAGSTLSSDFPAGVHPAPGFGVGYTAYLLEIDQAGTQIRRGGYFGGRWFLQMAASGDALVILASTNETIAPLPGDHPAIVPPESAHTTALVLKLDNANWSTVAAALYGGSAAEYHLSMALAPDGTPWLAGSTKSLELSVPGAIRLRSSGGEDEAFVAAFDATDFSLTFATWLGGRHREIHEVVAPADDGTAWVLGSTNSPDFPVLAPLPGPAFDPASFDLFAAHVAKGEPSLRPGVPLALSSEVLSGHAVGLTWTPPPGAPTGIAVDRRDGFAWQRIAVVAGDATQWTDATAVADHGYTYELQALNAAGGSPPSNPTHAVTPPTLSFAIRRGRFKLVGFGFSGKLQLAGTIAPLAGGAVDARAAGAEITLFASFGPVVVIGIPPNDAGWRVRKKRLSWRNGATRFDFDPVTGAFELRTLDLTPEVGVGNAMSVRFTSGQDAGTTANFWRASGRRRIRTP